jgi:hypothetical protein
MKKLPYLLAVFGFAFIFVIGIMLPEHEWRYDSAMRTIGQVGLGVSIILFFAVSKKKKKG